MNKNLIDIPKTMMERMDILTKTKIGKTGDEIQKEIESLLKENGKVEWKEGWYPATKTKFYGFDIKISNKNLAKKCKERVKEVGEIFSYFVEDLSEGIEIAWDKNKLAILLTQETNPVLKIMVNADDLSSLKGMISSDEYFPFWNSNISPILPITLGKLFHLIPLYIVEN